MHETVRNFLAVVATGCGVMVFVLSLILGDILWAFVGLLIAWFNYKNIK